MSNYPSFLGEEASVAQDLRGASPAAARRLVALTDDAALTRSLEELTATGIDVSVVSNAEALCDELLQSNSTVALVDSTTVQDPLEGLIDALATQFPDLRLLVAGHGAVQTQLATRIARGRVFRFVHKPASAQRLKLFVDAASRPAEPQRVSMTQTVEVLVDPQLAPARPEREPVHRRQAFAAAAGDRHRRTVVHRARRCTCCGRMANRLPWTRSPSRQAGHRQPDRSATWCAARTRPSPPDATSLLTAAAPRSCIATH